MSSRYVDPDCDPTKLYFKITNEDENHNGYQYKDGLNVLNKVFDIKGTCVAGGLYFSDPEHIMNFLSYGVHLRDITLPVMDPDLKMVKDPGHFVPDKWRANKIILGNRYDLSDLKTFEYMISRGTPASEVHQYILNLLSDSSDLFNDVHPLIKNCVGTNALTLFFEKTEMFDKAEKCLVLFAVVNEEWETVKSYIIKITKNKKKYTQDCELMIKLFYSGNMEIIRFAMDNKIDFKNLKNCALEIGHDKKFWDLVELAVKYKVNLKKRGFDLLIDQCAEGNLDRVKFLVENGANCKSMNGHALVVACSIGNLEMVKYFVEKGVDCRSNGSNAIQTAYYHGHHEIGDFLISMEKNKTCDFVKN